MSKANGKHATLQIPTEIGRPAMRALQSFGFTTLASLTKATERELLAMHGFGPKALRIIKSALDGNGLALASPEVEKTKRRRT
jgi:hypothetical protein